MRYDDDVDLDAEYDAFDDFNDYDGYAGSPADRASPSSAMRRCIHHIWSERARGLLPAAGCTRRPAAVPNPEEV